MRNEWNAAQAVSLHASTSDFSLVMEALERHTRATGQAPVSISGWEAEDEEIGPPEPLIASLEAVSTGIYGHTYLRDLREPKERAAVLFRNGVRLDGATLTEECVAILPNSTQALLLALAALRDQGIERIVIAAPVYFSAVEVCRRLGLEIAIIPTADFTTGALHLDALIRAMAPPRSALLLTNPAYSIGVEYDWSTLQALFAALSEDHPIILDETRMGLHWQREAPWYEAEFPAQAIVIRSPSKIFFISGAKSSLLFATPAFVRRVETLSESLLGSAPGALEETALTYLRFWRMWRNEARRRETGSLLRWRRGVVARLQTNLDLARPALERRGFAVSPVNSGPYALAARRSHAGGDLDCMRLARKHGALAMTAGYFFHEHPDWTGFRLNLSVPGAQLSAAVDRIMS